MKNQIKINRRNFLFKSASVATGISGMAFLSPPLMASPNMLQDSSNILGPQAGFSPHLGALLSMMTWMRATVKRTVAKLSQAELDFLVDSKANSIGAMLLHLAATETYYQLNTFEDKKWDSWDDSIKKKWDMPMNLGEESRKSIKGNNIDYYFSILDEVRDKTIAEFKKRDDEWLAKVDTGFWGSTNNHCKWFHVCEHESNHNGQIKFVIGRLP